MHVEVCTVHLQIVVCKSLRDTSSRLAELGWLHNKVRKYTDARSLDRAFGLVGQVCLCLSCALIIDFLGCVHKCISVHFCPLSSELLCLAPPGAEGVLQAAVCPPLPGTKPTYTVSYHLKFQLFLYFIFPLKTDLKQVRFSAVRWEPLILKCLWWLARVCML